MTHNKNEKPCKTNTSVNVNLYNNAVLLSDAKFKQNMTRRWQKVEKIKTINNKFKDMFEVSSLRTNTGSN